MMTPAQKRAAVLAAAKDLAANPHCYTGEDYRWRASMLVRSKEKRSLIDHLGGIYMAASYLGAVARCSEAGFNPSELHRIMRESETHDARQMLARTRRLCNELWPEGT